MKADHLRTDTMITEWFDGTELSQNTRKNYIVAMKSYTEFVGMSPEELIAHSEQEIIDGVLMRKRAIKRNLLGFRTMLKDRGPAPKSVHNHVSAVLSFYRFNYIDMPNMGERGNSAKPLKKNDTRLIRDDIILMLKHAGVRDRAIVLLMASSGLSSADVINLRVGTLRAGYDEATGITTLDLRRQKTEYDFYTFTTPEASTAIHDYLTLRDKNAQTSIHSDMDHVFIKRDVPKAYLESYNDSLRVLDAKGMLAIFRRLGDRCGKTPDKGTWGLIRAHNLRKWFFQSLMNDGASENMANYFMGHVTDSVTAAYWKADPGILKRQYMAFIPTLSFEDTEVRVVESEEYKELREMITDLAKYIIPSDEFDPHATITDMARHIKREHTDAVDALADSWNE